MGHFLNHFSFVLLALFAAAIAAAVTWRIRRRWLRAAIPATLLVAAAVAFFWLRTGAGNVHSVADLDHALASGKPVMIEFFSDY